MSQIILGRSTESTSLPLEGAWLATAELLVVGTGVGNTMTDSTDTAVGEWVIS